MIRIFITILCSVYVTFAQVDDTPGGNLTLEFDNIKGKCPIISGYLVSCNNTLYEGRWYATEVGFTQTQSWNLACTAWDTFFDKDGVGHNFLYTYERGQYRTLNTRLVPVPDKLGVYELDAGLNSTDKIYSTFYYMDTEMLVFWEVMCKENGDHSRNLVIGFRDLSMVDDKHPQLDRILTKLADEGGLHYTKVIYQGPDCRYPPLRKNPYK